MGVAACEAIWSASVHVIKDAGSTLLWLHYQASRRNPFKGSSWNNCNNKGYYIWMQMRIRIQMPYNSKQAAVHLALQQADQ